MTELNSRPKEQLKEQFFKGILLRAVSHLVFQQGIKILFKHWSCRQKSVLDKWPMYMRIRCVFAFLSKNSVHCEIEKICLNEKLYHHGARDIFNNAPNTFLSLWRCSFSFILFSTECDSHMTLILLILLLILLPFLFPPLLLLLFPFPLLLLFPFPLLFPSASYNHKIPTSDFEEEHSLPQGRAAGVQDLTRPETRVVLAEGVETEGEGGLRHRGGVGFLRDRDVNQVIRGRHLGLVLDRDPRRVLLQEHYCLGGWTKGVVGVSN